MPSSLLFRGKRLEYEIRGAGLPVMLLHGFMEDRRIWEPFLKGLEKKFRWILPDLPGSGQSELNNSLTNMNDFAEALNAVAEAENIQNMVLIGHSMGGYISLAFAEKYREKLLALGLFHSSSYADSPEKKEAREKNIRFIEKFGAAPFIEQSLPGLYSERYVKENPEEILKQIRRYQSFLPESVVLYLSAMKTRTSTTGVLESFPRPVLFIMGDQDKAVPLKDALAQCHLPRISCIQILSHTAHMGMMEETSLCQEFISYYLQQIPF
jgi:pimeloyl-ACP methyl ester carboxylesterase